jgi:hypothetical protein
MVKKEAVFSHRHIASRACSRGKRESAEIHSTRESYECISTRNARILVAPRTTDAQTQGEHAQKRMKIVGAILKKILLDQRFFEEKSPGAIFAWEPDG